MDSRRTRLAAPFSGPWAQRRRSRTFSPNSIFRAFIRGVKSATLKEADYRIEAGNIARLRGYRRPRLGVDIVRLVEEIPSNDEVLFMHEAPGVPFLRLKENIESLSHSQLLELGKAMSNLSQVFFDEAFFGKEGAFHGDLQEENFFVSEAAPKNSAEGYKITVLDVGNTNTLEMKVRKDFVELIMTCMSSRRPQDAVAIIGRFGKKLSPKTQKELTEKIREIFDNDESTPMQKMNLLMEEALRKKIDLPPGLATFWNSQRYLEHHLSAINQEIARRLGKPNVPTKFQAALIYEDVAKRRILEGLRRSVTSIGMDRNVVVTPTMIARHLGKNPQEVLHFLGATAGAVTKGPGLMYNCVVQFLRKDAAVQH